MASAKKPTRIGRLKIVRPRRIGRLVPLKLLKERRRARKNKGSTQAAQG